MSDHTGAYKPFNQQVLFTVNVSRRKIVRHIVTTTYYSQIRESKSVNHMYYFSFLQCGLKHAERIQF